MHNQYLLIGHRNTDSDTVKLLNIGRYPIANPILGATLGHYAFFFCTFCCPLGFFCTLTSSLPLSQCRQQSAAFSIQIRKTRTLRQTSCALLHIIHCQDAFLSSTSRNCQCTWRTSSWACTWVQMSSNWHSWAWQTGTYVWTYIVRIDLKASHYCIRQISIASVINPLKKYGRFLGILQIGFN